MCDSEFGKCDICGKEAPLSRKYYHYDIDCECCHSIINSKNHHFELVRHCKNCEPKPPKWIRLVKKPIDE